MEEPHNKSTKKSKNVDTLAAALGLKGPLRIVPQGVTRKPHIILKRVNDEDDPPAEGSSKRIARFAFTTAKRIQLKPDADLIFALEAPDGEALLLEGDIDTGTDSETEEPEDVPVPVKPKPVIKDHMRLPPKMRKCLERTTAYNDYYRYGPEKKFGFPGYPMSVPPTRVFSDAVVQTEISEPRTPTAPTPLTHPISTSASHITPSDDVPQSKSPLQLPSPVSADHAREPIIDDISVGAEHEGGVEESSSHRERSLSPMDFSSVESSPQCLPPAELPREDILMSLPALTSTETVPLTASISADDSLLLQASNDCEMLDTPPQQEVEPLGATHAHVLPSASEPEVSSHLPNKQVDDDISLESSNAPTAGPKASAPPQIEVEAPEIPKGPAIRHTSDNIGKPPPIWPRAMREQLASKRLHTNPTVTTPTSPRRTLQAPVDDPSSSPAPDPKTVAYIPSGSTVNPLGIRPSQAFKLPTGPRALVSNTPSALGNASAPTPKLKPVVVGSGWKAARNTLGSSSTASSSKTVAAGSHVQASSSPSSSTSTPNSQPAAVNKSTNGDGARPNLSQMLSYSPSPEPTESSQQSTGWSGWKPLSTQGSASTTTNEATNDMVDNRLSPSLKRAREEDHLPMKPMSSTEIKRENKEDTGHAMKRARHQDKDEDLPSESMPAHKSTHRRNPSALVVLPMPRLPLPQPPVSSPAVTKPKALPTQLTHPLPAKPLLAINGGPVHSGSSYRPNRLDSWESRDSRERDDRDDFSTSRRKRIRDHHDEFTERDRDRSTSAGPSSTKGGSSHSTSTRHHKNAGSTSSTGPQWPATTTSTISKLEGQGGGDLSILQVAVSSDGVHVALICADRSVRVWTTKQPALEVARLYNTAMPACIIWDSRDTGIVTLCNDGVVGSWMKKNTSYREWQFAKWFTVNEVLESTTTLFMAYWRDRIAVSTPSGVKLWILTNGQWKSQRDIVRSGVTAIKFVRDGEVLMGGCKDGVMWCCEVPNGTLRVHMFLPNGRTITSIEAHPSGSNLLVTQEGGQSHLVTFRATENKGSIEKTYTSERLQLLANNKGSHERQLPAIFATRGQAVLFGVLNACTLIWDRKKGVIVYGLKHEEDDLILAAATFDGRPNMDGWMITGTQRGRLYWWPQPVAAASNADDRKKQSTS